MIRSLPWSICPVTVSASIFISLSFWEVSLSCPYYFSSSPTAFNPALAWNPRLYHLLQTFTCPLSLRSPKITCTGALFSQTYVVLDLFWSFGPWQTAFLSYVSDLLHHRNSSGCRVQLTSWACPSMLPVSPRASQSPGNTIRSGTQTSLIHAP